MAITPTGSGTAISELARTLMQTFDSNKDGALSADEFSGFLDRLVGSLGQSTLGQTAYGGAAANSMPGPLGGPGVRFEGFNFDREQNVERSAKDAFAMLASRAGSMPMTKAEAEQWFNTNIRAEMERLGHKINWVQGDKFEFTNWQGTFVVDFLRGADGPDPALAWQTE